jgi:hypothetical protein
MVVRARFSLRRCFRRSFRHSEIVPKTEVEVRSVELGELNNNCRCRGQHYKRRRRAVPDKGLNGVLSHL